MRTIIFDFDGTIADTFALVVKIFEDVVRGSVPVTEEELNKLRKIGLSARWAQELGIPLWKAPFMLTKGRRLMRRRMQHIETFNDLPEVLRALHNSDAVLIIMSSNSEKTIRSFLTRKQLDVYFTRVYGGVGLFKKARTLKRIIKRNNLDPAHTFYIGDEVRDIQAAKHAGLNAVAVTWGFNDYDLLIKHQPYAIAKTPKDLLKTLQSNPASKRAA